MAKKTLKDAISHGEASALLAVLYTTGFFTITAYLVINAMAYTLAGTLVQPTFPSEIFGGLLNGEFMVLGYYYMKNNGKEKE